MTGFQNLFGNLPTAIDQELVEVLARGKHFHVERIVSTGHASPEDFWYDQEQDEWVIVLQGEAKLRFEAPEESLHLKTGDYLTIPAHRRHRVEWTTTAEPTVWLAVHYEGMQN